MPTSDYKLSEILNDDDVAGAWREDMKPAIENFIQTMDECVDDAGSYLALREYLDFLIKALHLFGEGLLILYLVHTLDQNKAALKEAVGK